MKEKRLRGERGSAGLERKPEGKEEGGGCGKGKDQEAFNGPGAIVDHSTASFNESLVEVR